MGASLLIAIRVYIPGAFVRFLVRFLNGSFTARIYCGSVVSDVIEWSSLFRSAGWTIGIVLTL